MTYVLIGLTEDDINWIVESYDENLKSSYPGYSESTPARIINQIYSEVNSYDVQWRKLTRG